MKRFSLPERVPFDLSEDNFAIVTSESISETTEEPVDIRERELRDRKRGERESDRSSGHRDGSPNRTGTSSDKTEVKDSANRPGAGTQGDVMTLSASGGGSYYICSFNGMPLAEYDIDGNLVRDYIYVGGQLVAEFRPPNTYYYYTSDQINSTRIVTNNGNVVYSAAFDPYGGVQKTWTSTYTPTLKFSGKERDGESGLDYFGARYYDKGQYRFISVDPIIDQVAAFSDLRRWNLYSYCGGNPTTYLDFDGGSYLMFDRKTRQIGIFGGAGGLIGWYNASNNVWGNHRPWPQGAYRFIEWHPSTSSGNFALPWDAIDAWGIWVFDVKGRLGMGFHSGRSGMTDEWGHSDWEYVTNGCIRGEVEATCELHFTQFNNDDAPTYMYVFDDLNAYLFSVALAAAAAVSFLL